MSTSTRPLPVHPPPRTSDTIATWIEQLAAANEVPFPIMFEFITNHARDCGITKALNRLTGVSLEAIIALKNPFKRLYWANPKECPLKSCYLISDDRSWLLAYHLVFKHELGVRWYTCPSCRFISKYSQNLYIHQNRMHYSRMHFSSCNKSKPLFDFMTTL